VDRLLRYASAAPTDGRYIRRAAGRLIYQRVEDNAFHL
jgi:hypothetical protein